MVQAVVFDWDGVLVDSEPIFHQVEREVLRSFCGEVPWDPDAVEEALAAMSGHGALEAFELCRGRLGYQAPAADMVQAWKEGLKTAYLRSPLMAAAMDVVRRLGHHDMKLAVATSSPLDLLNPLVDTLGVRPLFDTIVSADEAGAAKPAPDVYVEACRRLQVDPQHAVAVEDTPAGLAAALAAGMKCIAIPRRATLFGDFSGAHRVARRLADVRIELLADLYTRTRGQVAEGQRAAVYARSADSPHAEALLHQQSMACLAVAQDCGWTVVTHQRDRHPGRPWNERPGLMRIMEKAWGSELDLVLITDPAVLSPGVIEQAQIVNELAQHGVEVQIVFRTEPSQLQRRE